jgi:hypothetical protein
LSPASKATTSPGTSSREETLRSWPSRTTRAVTVIICASASSALSARDSWTNPTTVLAKTTPRMTAVLTVSPIAYVTTAATSST